MREEKVSRCACALQMLKWMEIVLQRTNVTVFEIAMFQKTRLFLLLPPPPNKCEILLQWWFGDHVCPGLYWTVFCWKVCITGDAFLNCGIIRESAGDAGVTRLIPVADCSIFIKVICMTGGEATGIQSSSAYSEQIFTQTQDCTVVNREWNTDAWDREWSYALTMLPSRDALQPLSL